MLPVVAASNGYTSDANNLIFLQQTGSAVSPTPEEHIVSLANGTLTERVYPATGGTAPNWTFASTPESTTELATNVGPGLVGGESSTVPAVPVLRLPGRAALDHRAADAPERVRRRTHRGSDRFLRDLPAAAIRRMTSTLPSACRTGRPAALARQRGCYER